MMGQTKKLSDIAKIDISSIDKKIKENEDRVKLCNFTDVYNNWAITKDMLPSFMIATASKQNIERFLLKKGQVAITKDSETRDDIGISTYIADNLPNTVLGYHCALITPDEQQVNGKYLNAYLSSQMGRKYFEYQSSGSGQRYTLTTEAIGSVKIYLPDIKIQERIGNFFSELDKKISVNNKIISELESLAKTIYDYWFLQFDFSDENGRPYRSSGGKMVWNNELKKEIPEGWEVGNLYNIADFTNGLACQNYRPENNDEGLPVIKIKEMHDGITKDTERVSNTIPIKNIVENGDILFSWSATLEVKFWFGEKCGLNQHIFKVLPRSYYSKEYVYKQLSAYVINFIKIAEARKTTMGHITSDHLRQSKIVLPLKGVINRYTNVTKNLYREINNLNKTNSELASLRDFLLPLLMNGQVKIKD